MKQILQKLLMIVCGMLGALFIFYWTIGMHCTIRQQMLLVSIQASLATVVIIITSYLFYSKQRN